jgi:hypothetical protein
MEGSLSFHDKILLEVHIEATDEVPLILKETMDEVEGLFSRLFRLGLRWWLWAVGQRNDIWFEWGILTLMVDKMIWFSQVRPGSFAQSNLIQILPKRLIFRRLDQDLFHPTQFD